MKLNNCSSAQAVRKAYCFQIKLLAKPFLLLLIVQVAIIVWSHLSALSEGHWFFNMVSADSVENLNFIPGIVMILVMAYLTNHAGAAKHKCSLAINNRTAYAANLLCILTYIVIFALIATVLPLLIRMLFYAFASDGVLMISVFVPFPFLCLEFLFETLLLFTLASAIFAVEEAWKINTVTTIAVAVALMVGLIAIVYGTAEVYPKLSQNTFNIALEDLPKYQTDLSIGCTMVCMALCATVTVIVNAMIRIATVRGDIIR